MNAKEFLKELQPFADQHEFIAERIKSHNLPVIVYGAAKMAQMVTEELNQRKIKISGYAVDEEYFEEDTTYLNLPVYNFNELSKTPNKYVFVMAFKAERSNVEARILNRKDLFIYKFNFNRFIFHIPMNYSFINDHAEILTDVYNKLEDDLSRESMMTYFKTLLVDYPRFNEKIYDPKQYFNSVTEKFLSNRGGVFADCGAFKGDSIKSFVDWTKGNYKKIYSIEANEKTFSTLKEYVKNQNYPNVELFNGGVWSEKGVLSFQSVDEFPGGSRINKNGTVKINVESLDNLITEGQVDFIKMDIEGSEMPALRGAENLIQNNKPYLAICVYHKLYDLITIPQYIKSLHNDYKLYLRKHANNYWELVLYAIP